MYFQILRKIWDHAFGVAKLNESRGSEMKVSLPPGMDHLFTAIGVGF